LGRMYVCDERFKNNIDKSGEGTAKFVAEAIKFCCKK
ncbi:MAG: TipAS antibiotic-recognition domain-containing protein, partial [Clostridia bacterium]|nr:TipAS antibiotic-recognition domain-containing protein [Clostridia bacterium]